MSASVFLWRLCKHFANHEKEHKDTKETLVPCAAGTGDPFASVDNIFNNSLFDANLAL